MKMFLSFLCAACLSVLPETSGAQEETHLDVTEYNFSDDVLVGDLVGPVGDRVNARPRGHQKSLIRVRTQFVAELLRSLETL